MVSVSIRSTFYHFEDAQCTGTDEQPMVLRAVTAPHKLSLLESDLQVDSDSGVEDDSPYASCEVQPAVQHINTGDDFGDVPRMEDAACHARSAPPAFFVCTYLHPVQPVQPVPAGVGPERESTSRPARERATSGESACEVKSSVSEASSGSAPVLLGRVGRSYATRAEREGDAHKPQRTTLMLRNLPIKYTREDLVDLLVEKGFAGKFDFMYFPIDFETEGALGYAFVNCQTPADAEHMKRSLDGFSRWSLPCSKVCSVSWSQPLQGLEAHVARYRNSPLMHELVPDNYRPMLFAEGQRVAFPPPTKKIPAPRKGSKRMFAGVR